MPYSLESLTQQLLALPRRPLAIHTSYYKRGPGDYAESDRWLGIRNPDLRRLAIAFAGRLPLHQVEALLGSAYNEKRLLALLLLVYHYRKATPTQQQAIFDTYLHHKHRVNNWNLVDASAHHIVGAHLYQGDAGLLEMLDASPHLWTRRIAMVATLYFIRHGQLEWTFRLAKKRLHDTHDLMHKATGWMLREAGKKDVARLCAFLDSHTAQMPRTMLRYAIERLPQQQRKAYLAIPRGAIQK